MSSEITDKTKVLITRLGDFWVNEKQAHAYMAIKEAEPASSIEIDGNIIAVQSVDGVLTADQYQTYNLKRRGGWQCKYQKWHERNQSCAHAQAPGVA